MACEFYVRGRVQGVGFRWFVQRAATEIGLTGFARNESDGRVYVYAVGTGTQLSQLAGRLHKGPQFSEVRGVDEHEAVVRRHGSFEIES